MITVAVHAGNGERAIRQLKRRMQYELIFRLMKESRFYEPPSVMRVRKKQEAERRIRKNSRRRFREEN
ncbi:MAG: ribosomal protein [Pseudomonadota bacterium]